MWEQEIKQNFLEEIRENSRMLHSGIWLGLHLILLVVPKQIQGKSQINSKSQSGAWWPTCLHSLPSKAAPPGVRERAEVPNQGNDGPAPSFTQELLGRGCQSQTREGKRQLFHNNYSIWGPLDPLTTHLNCSQWLFTVFHKTHRDLNPKEGHVWNPASRFFFQVVGAHRMWDAFNFFDHIQGQTFLMIHPLPQVSLTQGI